MEKHLCVRLGGGNWCYLQGYDHRFIPYLSAAPATRGPGAVRVAEPSGAEMRTGNVRDVYDKLSKNLQPP